MNTNRRETRVKRSITFLQALLVALASGALVAALQVNAQQEQPTLELEPLASQSSTPPAAAPWAPSTGFADLIESVNPAVAHVATSGFVDRSRGRSLREFRFPPGWEDFFRDFDRGEESDEDEEPQSRPLGIGTGFLISADGFLVTNHHVINGADEIVVTLNEGDEYDADVVGSDPKTDLALVKLRKANDLPFLQWGDDRQSRVGDWVIAIGNPFGLGGSASTGIISALGRDIRSGPYDDYIQVDAAINRGNSGGPLFNMSGQVIGINTAIYSPNGGSVGIGFSIPSSMAKGVIRQLREEGSVSRGWIGVGIQGINEDLADSLGRSDQSGALITYIEPDGPASKAELKVGDIILEFDDRPVDEMRDLPRIVADSSVGDTFALTIWRDGQEQTINITTERFPEDEKVASAESSPTPIPEEAPVLDAALSAITTELRRRYSIDESIDGVLVLEVERRGLAANNGLRRGDVIAQLDGGQVATPEEIAEIVGRAKDDERTKLSMLLIRGGSPRFLAFDLTD